MTVRFLAFRKVLIACETEIAPVSSVGTAEICLGFPAIGSGVLSWLDLPAAFRSKRNFPKSARTLRTPSAPTRDRFEHTLQQIRKLHTHETGWKVARFGRNSRGDVRERSLSWRRGAVGVHCARNGRTLGCRGRPGTFSSKSWQRVDVNDEPHLRREEEANGGWESAERTSQSLTFVVYVIGLLIDVSSGDERPTQAPRTCLPLAVVRQGLMPPRRCPETIRVS